MFLGHYAVALAAKRAAPNTSLGVLVAAAQWLDLIWPVLLIAGVEHARPASGGTPFTNLQFTSYPISHSLLMAIVWGALFALAYWLRTRWTSAAVILGLVVVSHWMLDWVTHVPDLPLTPGGSARVGLGLWNSVAGTLVVELAMFVIGIAIYLRATRARDKIGSWGTWALLVVLLLLYGANFAGPPPSNERTLGCFGLLGWLVPLWAWWTDRHRAPAGAGAAPNLS
jgi:membrane-bound metal-dependent hydrolase YbcI (DUF457 family)